MNKSLLIGSVLLALFAAVVANPPYKAATNLAALEDKFNTYKLDLKRLRGAANNIRRTLANNKANETLGIAALQEGMASERDILYNIEGYLTLPFGVSRCDCYAISSSERTRLSSDIKEIKESLSSLQRVISALQSQDKVRELQAEVIRQKQYVNILEQTFNSPCCGGYKVKKLHPQTPSGETDLSSNIYQTNIKATNWIYGGLTQSQLRLRYFSRSASRNVTNCPLETPFFNGKECINCVGNFPFWDMAKEKCSACAPDFKYNQAARDCEQVITKTQTREVSVIVKPIRQKQVTEIVQPLRGPKVINTVRTTRRSSSKSRRHRTSSKTSTSEVRRTSGHESVDAALDDLF